MKSRKTNHNRRLAQWRVTWLIEHSTSHQLLWCIDSFVPTPPPCPPSGYIIEPSDDDTYFLRPIPCDEVFNKNNQETVYSQSINVFDYNGNLMFTTKGDNVNVKNLKPGIYFIKATINNEIITKKIIKK